MHLTLFICALQCFFTFMTVIQVKSINIQIGNDKRHNIYMSTKIIIAVGDLRNILNVLSK